MKVSIVSWDEMADDTSQLNFNVNPDLVIYFGDGHILEKAHKQLQSAAPHAILLGCSSAGQIANHVSDGLNFVAAAIKFASTKVKSASCQIGGDMSSTQAGRKIGQQLQADDLACVILLSDGTQTNGADLAKSISDIVGTNISVVGALAADGDRFDETLVGLNANLSSGQVAAVGLYGTDIHIGHSSQGGWRPFGPRRIVTKSDGNILYELDGEPALDLYERYLGDEADELPASGLLFPLQISEPNVENSETTRTILNINRKDKSLIFAGTMPEGAIAQLMKASHEGLIEGAAQAAAQAAEQLPKEQKILGEFAFLLTCVDRRLVMKQRTEEEVEAVGEELGLDMPRIGFYSYGEICPKIVGGMPRLQNQTMTISLFSETAGGGNA
ncbi:MAG: FIST C-terminal domain-containing protein [Alphaproteobacteria bacterium]|nr:FIST C-terminal domain-containing protein [Alphaproteobacteria bacterium]